MSKQARKPNKSSIEKFNIGVICVLFFMLILYEKTALAIECFQKIKSTAICC